MENQTTKFDYVLWRETISDLHKEIGPYLASLLHCHVGQIIHWQEVGLKSFSRPFAPDLDQFMVICRMTGLPPGDFFVTDIRIHDESEEIPWD